MNIRDLELGQRTVMSSCRVAAKKRNDVSSSTLINPDRKPTELSPQRIVPYYVGMPPDLGTTYSSMQCQECNKSSVLSKHHGICPYCGGKTMSSLADMDATQLLTSMKSSPYSTIASPCMKCGSEIVTSINSLDDVEQLHCPNCGEVMGEYYESLKAFIDEEKQFATANTLTGLKIGASVKV